MSAGALAHTHSILTVYGVALSTAGVAICTLFLRHVIYNKVVC
jgi:hypothetical protein